MSDGDFVLILTSLRLQATIAAFCPSIPSNHLRDQFPCIPTLKQLQPRLRHILELRIHDLLALLVADLQLAVLERLDEEFNGFGGVGEEVRDDEAADGQAHRYDLEVVCCKDVNSCSGTIPYLVKMLEEGGRRS